MIRVAALFDDRTAADNVSFSQLRASESGELPFPRLREGTDAAGE